LGGNDFVESTVTINVQVIRSPLQVKREDKAHQAEVMISMQVADKNMIDAMKVGLHPHQLHLRSFSTVNKERSILNLYVLSSRMSPISGHSSA
jgi:hypothetical protein